MKFKLTEDLDDKFRNFKIDVHYDKLPITYYGETHDYSYYEPPDTDEYEDDVEWDYTIDWTDFAETVRDCLTEDESHLNEIFEELGFKKVNELTDDEFNEQINSEEMDEYPKFMHMHGYSDYLDFCSEIFGQMFDLVSNIDKKEQQ